MKADDKELIARFFPNLTPLQWQQLEQLPELYKEWNTKINVVSRKDIENIVPNHILHSLSIALFTRFREGTKVFDIGTGGGLPGIPLAILYPNCHFTLIDSIGKKIKVVQSIVESLGLSNARPLQIRAEEYKEAKCHYIVSRAAMPMPDLMRIGTLLVERKEQLNALPNGVIALKGGDLTEELKPFRKIVSTEEVQSLIPGIPFFEGKKIVYIPL